MKQATIIRLFPLLIFLQALLTSCEEKPVTPIDPVKESFGRIILPEGSVVNLGDYFIVSPTGDHKIDSDGSFDSTGIGRTEHLLLANNSRGETLLLAYPIEGEEIVISPESSAIALLMMTMNTSSLTIEERKEAIQYFKMHPNFSALVSEISGLAKQGKELFSLENTSLIADISAFYTNQDGGRLAGINSTFPITFTRVGSKLSFQNKTSAHYYTAGIYKDDKSLKTMPIEAAKFNTRSVTTFLGGILNGNIDPWVKSTDGGLVNFELEGQGEFKVRITSGRTLLERCCSDEGRMSNRMNGHAIIGEMFDAIGKGILDLVPNECAGAVSNMFYDAAKLIPEDVEDKDEFMITISDGIADLIENTIEGVGECAGSVNYLKTIGKAINIIGKTKAVLHGYKISSDWFSYPIKFEKEFMISAYAVSIIDGDGQVGDPSKSLPKPLSVEVVDEEGNILKGIEVEWFVKKGGGIVSAAKTLTNNEGVAQVGWILGKEFSAEQEVEAIVKKMDGTLVNGAPATFTANIDIAAKLINGSPWKLTSYVTDGDEQFEFQNLGNKTCYPDGIYDKDRFVEGTFSFNSTTLTRNIKSEVHTYNCNSGSFDISYSNHWSGASQWKIDKVTGKLVLMNDGQEGAWLTITIISDNKIRFDGTAGRGNDEISISFEIEE